MKSKLPLSLMAYTIPEKAIFLLSAFLKNTISPFCSLLVLLIFFPVLACFLSLSGSSIPICLYSSVLNSASFSFVLPSICLPYSSMASMSSSLAFATFLMSSSSAAIAVNPIISMAITHINVFLIFLFVLLFRFVVFFIVVFHQLFQKSAGLVYGILQVAAHSFNLEG